MVREELWGADMLGLMGAYDGVLLSVRCLDVVQIAEELSEQRFVDVWFFSMRRS